MSSKTVCPGIHSPWMMPEVKGIQFHSFSSLHQVLMAVEQHADLYPRVLCNQLQDNPKVKQQRHYSVVQGVLRHIQRRKRAASLLRVILRHLILNVLISSYKEE